MRRVVGVAFLIAVGCRRGNVDIRPDDARAVTVPDSPIDLHGIPLQLTLVDANSQEILERYAVRVPIDACVPIRTPRGDWIQVQPSWAGMVYEHKGPSGPWARIFEVHLYTSTDTGFKRTRTRSRLHRSGSPRRPARMIRSSGGAGAAISRAA